MPSISKSGLKLINKDTLWDKAYFSLKSALLAGKFVPGERIILRKVAQDLGISLTPVRDAINRLAAENVLERGGVGQGGGASVPLLNANEFDQLMSIRSSLEPLDIFVGGAELPQMQKQSIDFSVYRNSTNAQGIFKNIPEKNHYTILDELTDKNGEIFKSINNRLI